MLLSRSRLLLVLAASAILASTSLYASKHAYKKTTPLADDSAWYVGMWQGSNLAFDPPLDVEITILPDGRAFNYAHGGNRSYEVSTHGKVIKVKQLPDTPIRGKMQSANSMILEDGGKLEIDSQGELLKTTAPKLGIVVLYKKVTDENNVREIAARVQQQEATEPHHKDNDFWHSSEFWGNVIGSAIVDAHSHDDHIEINSTLTQSDVDNLTKYYKDQ